MNKLFLVIDQNEHLYQLLKETKFDIKNSMDDDIFILERTLDDENVLFISNLSKKVKSINHDIDGNYENLLNGELIKLSSKQNLEFNSWDYLLLKKIDIK